MALYDAEIYNLGWSTNKVFGDRFFVASVQQDALNVTRKSLTHWCFFIIQHKMPQSIRYWSLPSVAGQIDMDILFRRKVDVGCYSRAKEGLNLALPVSPHFLGHVLFGLEF